MPRVVVTGLGLVTAIGSNVKKSWGAMLNAQDGTSEITSFDTSKYKVHRACEIKSLNSNKIMEAKKRYTVYDCLHVATKEALQDSGILHCQELERDKIGISIGTLAGELSAFEHRLKDHPDNKASGFSMDVVLTYPPVTLSTQLAEDFQIEGPNTILINACSSGNHALCWAFDLLQEQKVNAMVVGGSDVVPQTEFTHFHNLKALAPEKCQPFDRNRQGLVVGAGAGVLILETLEHATRRGANIYAE
ncbi:MAG: beta-ketoacyl-[acyl-carrier-protein] synthase family protein, partial [Candidatus Brocadiales bacterium]